MKRLDDKIKEIEKKDKTNRILYIVVVVLLVGIMAYVYYSQGVIEGQEEVIDMTTEQLIQKNKELEATNITLQETIDKLESSQTPAGFWNETQEIGTTHAYLAYIMYDREAPAVEFRGEALAKVVDEAVEGDSRWLYIGKKSGDEMSGGETSVVWRNETDSVNDNWVPEENDIVEIKGSAGRFTYSSFGAAQNKTGTKVTWNPDVKAIVLERKMDGPEAVFLRVKF